MRPMGPMPYGTRRHGLIERIGGGRPLAGRLLAGKDEPGSVSAGEPRDEGCEVLTPPSLRIGDSLHRLRKLIGLHWRRAVMLPPHLKELSDALATGIVGLQYLDPLDRISTAEG